MYKNMQLLCTIEKSNEALKTLKNDFEKKSFFAPFSCFETTQIMFEIFFHILKNKKIIRCLLMEHLLEYNIQY